jgi:hypothetical protein
VNYWLGGRDSNPDTQIQSSLEGPSGQYNQGVSSADQGQVRQNPQHGRNENSGGGDRDGMAVEQAP